MKYSFSLTHWTISVRTGQSVIKMSQFHLWPMKNSRQKLGAGFSQWKRIERYALTLYMECKFVSVEGKKKLLIKNPNKNIFL